MQHAPMHRILIGLICVSRRCGRGMIIRLRLAAEGGDVSTAPVLNTATDTGPRPAPLDAEPSSASRSPTPAVDSGPAGTDQLGAESVEGVDGPRRAAASSRCWRPTSSPGATTSRTVRSRAGSLRPTLGIHRAGVQGCRHRRLSAGVSRRHQHRRRHPWHRPRRRIRRHRGALRPRRLGLSDQRPGRPHLQRRDRQRGRCRGGDRRGPRRDGGRSAPPDGRRCVVGLGGGWAARFAVLHDRPGRPHGTDGGVRQLRHPGIRSPAIDAPTARSPSERRPAGRRLSTR